MMHADANPKNFIEQIIETDLQTGKHQAIKLRFPPEPNGYLHIGHAKSICLNFGLANKYQGKCHLRFDDTNPEKESIEYVEAIKRDVQWLGFQWHGDVRFSSDYFQQLYDYALVLINKGLAYVDELSPDEIREYRGTLKQPGRHSPYRDRSVAENLTLFEKMRRGEFKEGEACLRAKIDMASSFMVMRDPVLYRVRFLHHHQTGDAWCIYPMYDFTHCISDAIEGITHSLCTLEFQDNRRLYDWILDHIAIDTRPYQYEFSRLNLEYTIMSKRKLTQLVAQKHVNGWDDPRMPTISGMRRRGYPPAAIIDFCRRIGITKQDNVVEMSLLESCVRDELNQHASRAMAVLNPIVIVIENFPTDQVQWLEMARHPNDPEMGTRQVPFSREIFIDAADFREQANKHYKRLVLGKEVRLRGSYVIQANDVQRDDQGNVTKIFCTYDPQTLGQAPADGRKVKGVIHWVSVAHALPAEIRLYDRLFQVPNPSGLDNLQAALNPDSCQVIHQAYLEPSLQNAALGQTFQFEREGYFCVDDQSQADRLIFNRTVELRDSWAKLESRDNV